MLANLRIRWKLVAIFLLPALTLSTVAVTRIVSTLSDGFQADRELRSLQFSTRVAALAGELQGERTLSTQWAGTGKAQGGEELTTQRARVDRALADLRANAEELGPELGGARVTRHGRPRRSGWRRWSPTGAPWTGSRPPRPRPRRCSPRRSPTCST